MQIDATLLLFSFQVYRHIKVITVVACISCARRPAPVRTRHTNRLNPENNRGVRNVPLPCHALRTTETPRIKERQKKPRICGCKTYWDQSWRDSPAIDPLWTVAGKISRPEASVTSHQLNWSSEHIGSESVPIQLAQCWFPGLAISSAKM